MGETSAVRLTERQSPRMTQAERVAVSDTNMFEAAIDLINERGTHHTLLKDVGEAAGYSRGLASNRFGSKEALFLTLVKFCQEKWREDRDAILGGRSGLDAFLGTLDAVEDFLLNRRKYLQAMYIISYESICSYPEVCEQVSRHYGAARDEVMAWLEEAIDKGDIRADFDVETFTVMSRSFVSGTIYQWLINPDAIDVKKVLGEYRKMSLGFLACRS